MVMPFIQKPTEEARTVPILWRDCSWRIRIFIHTRVGRKRMISPEGVRVIPAPHSPVNGNCAPMPGPRFWRGGRKGHRKAAFRLAYPRLTSTLARCEHKERRQSIRFAGSWKARRDRRGTERSRAGFPSARTDNNRLLLQRTPAWRLQPVLAFAASQLGGMAPSRLRIYSVFEYRNRI